MMMDTETGYVTEESEALCECGCKADDHECGSCRECKIVCETEDRKSTRLNSSHSDRSRMPSSA